jgi:threonine dehydrogenase-like Zn-dependent dehydrogenase
VGLFAIKSCFLLGAARVIAIDRFQDRLDAATKWGAETVNYEHADVLEWLREVTGGRGPDACIDAVGMEAHGTSVAAFYDRAKQKMMMETDRPIALRQAIQACRKGGIVSIPGVYGGLIDKFPMGAAFAKGLTLRMGQTHVHRYMQPLLDRVRKGDIDPSAVITHRMDLDQAEYGYQIFQQKEDRCIKVVMKP